ncbi:putative ribosomal protein L11/L12 [Helianthus annuus]|nr:putative ribosomal protein L11/L12 [Helianthus annuus]
MPRRFDPSQVVDVYVRVTSGEVGAASSLAQKSAHSVSPQRKSEKTSTHPKSSTSAIPNPCGNPSTFSPARSSAGTVKEILGTCFSVGYTVDGKDPKDLQQEMVVVVVVS